MSCDLFLDDHTPDVVCDNAAHLAAISRRADNGNKWGAIVRGQDAGGIRDFLDGKPIHCGSGLELQAIDYRDDDYGTYTIYLNKSVGVRYEVDFARARGGGYQYGPDAIVLYASVGGHSFTTPHHQWMRFRWPER